MTRRLNRFQYQETMFLYGVIGMLCFLRTFEGASLVVPGSSSSDSSKSTEDHARDLTYIGEWIPNRDSGAQSDDTFDSTRNRSSRTVFVVPTIRECPEGYELDAMKECQREVNIDPQAHQDFLIEQLNAYFTELEKSGEPLWYKQPLKKKIPVIPSPLLKSTINSTEIPDQSDKSPLSIEELNIPSNSTKSEIYRPKTADDEEGIIVTLPDEETTENVESLIGAFNEETTGNWKTGIHTHRNPSYSRKNTQWVIAKIYENRLNSENDNS